MHSSHPLPQAFRAEPSFWIPEPQQSLVDVVAAIYGIYRSDQKTFSSLLYYLHRLNPGVLNVNTPLGRCVLKIIDLYVHSQQALLSENPDAVVKHLQRQFQLQELVYQRLKANLPHKPADIQSYRLAVGFLTETGSVSMTLSSLAVGTMQHTTGKPLQAALSDLLEVHRLKKIGGLNAKQFELQQKIIIRRISKALGWTEKYHFGFKTAKQALYSNYSHGMKPTMKVMDMIEHVKFLNVVSKGGGLLLTAIGLKMSCNATEEAKADKRVAVTYHEIGGLLGTSAAGVVLSLIEVTGPVGWVVGLGLAVAGGILGSAAGSEFTDFAYKNYGDVFRLANNQLIQSWCSR